jgi:peptidoglycan/LPS O-acetylase OafA/YrhL
VSFVVLKSWNPVLRWSVLTVLMVVIPFIVFHVIESPMIEQGKKIAKLIATKARPQSMVASQVA